jgi:prepilin-type N-terminal cleavage/methylation domain-containing protein
VVHQQSEIRNPQSGFTLIELLVAMSVMVTLMAVAVPFFRVQARSVGANAGRMDAHLNAQFAVNSIDRDLRVAGAGIVDAQPLIVYAAANAVTFNADLVSTDPGDPGAVYLDPDAIASLTTVLPRERPITLPLSASTYPDSTYWLAVGLPSRAETISYWIEPDGSAPGTFIMYRRVNDGDATVVARALRPATGPVFRYFKVDSLGRQVEISPARLPIMHLAPLHGSARDTGSSALTDSIRGVRVSLLGIYDDPDKGEVSKRIQTGVRLMNAGLVKQTSCGEQPLPAMGLVAGLSSADPPQITVSWGPSPDEKTGEADIQRYALFRREAAALDWGDPFASVAGGLDAYSYVDADVQYGQTWVYAVSAQDCTPANSDIIVSNAVVTPPAP